MCEETENYLWALQDILGHGATSQVYKAYEKNNGTLVAAKVYQLASNSRSAYGGGGNGNRERDYRPLLEREMDILKAANHENIVRYIAVEPVISSNPDQPRGTREALFIEYCNGGSLQNVLEQPQNRYGLAEDEFMLVFRHIVNALKYLHNKNTIHRDIKPDNIMLSININGERTYKLADLGVARLINEGENAFTSLVGTEEYIHPDLYKAAIPDNRTNALRTALQTRVDFPFEVDLWSFGVTLYQCATGELPFQPYAGTRKDRGAMKVILETKPAGCISGIEENNSASIQWSKTLPASCRLSSGLKQHLERLLQKLLESDRRKLMTFADFFRETDRIFNLIPIYYINLKRFQLTCGYFEPNHSIMKIFDELRVANGDSNKEEYYCLFQNVPYPIEKSLGTSIKEFREQLPIPTSREHPLVFYTFSPLQKGDSYQPTLYLPEVKPIRQYNDVASAYEWSKDIVGFFFYIKAQLIDYQNILQTAQCSTTIVQQHLKGKLLEFLCSVRYKLINFRVIEELKNIIDQLDSCGGSNGTAGSQMAVTPPPRVVPPSIGKDGVQLGFSHLCNNNAPVNDGGTSPGSIRRSSSGSYSSQLIQQSTRNYLRSFLEPYKQLTECERNIINMFEKEFGGQLGTTDDSHAYLNTLWSSDRTKTYLTWIQKVDKSLSDLNELHDSFRKDRMLSTYNRLQSDSHFRRRENLNELHRNYIHFVKKECSTDLLKVFSDYNDWIRERSAMIKDFEQIQISYEQQCSDIMDYVEMIDNLRTVIQRNIRELTSSPSSNESSMFGLGGTGSVRPDRPGPGDIGLSGIHASILSDSDRSRRNVVQDIHQTTRISINEAERNLSTLDHLIKQLRDNVRR